MAEVDNPVIVVTTVAMEMTTIHKPGKEKKNLYTGLNKGTCSLN